MHFKTITTAGLLFAALGTTGAMAADQPETTRIDEVPGGTYQLDPLHSKITWTVDHYGFSHYSGQFAQLEGSLDFNSENPARSQLEITVPLSSVATTSDGLNEHLLSEDFFHASEYPVATFTSTDIEMTGDNTATITGDLTLRGETHPLEIDATFNRAAVYPFDETYTLGFDGTATLDRSDYGIDYILPKDGQQGVSDQVRLDIEAEFKQTQ